MITKELVEQWLQESGNYEVAVAQVEYIAQRAAAHGAAQRDAELMGVGVEPVTPDYFEHEDDDDTWRECPDDCDIIESAGGSDLIIGSEYECEVAWRGKQRFRVTKLPDDADDDYEVKLISSSHDFYTADQLTAARLQGADEMKQLLAEYRETVDSAVERGNQIVLLNARITDLERVNQGLLEALETISTATACAYSRNIANAAIAAAEKEAGK